MDIFDQAICYAVKMHSGTLRKGTNMPYIVHPMEAAAIVATMTDDPEILAAAVLHDTVEDTAASLEDIRREFGERVANLVAGESENKREDIAATDTWKVRKQETLNHLVHASIEEKMITLGDKLSNIRAMYRDYLAIGDRLWDRFNQKDKREHAWYYGTIGDLLSDLSGAPAYEEYVKLVKEVFGE